MPITPLRRICSNSGVQCSCLQLSLTLKLACAVTIHKSQGLTLDKVVIDPGKKEFSCGLTYVACSRVSQLTDLYFRDSPHTTPSISHGSLPHHPLLMLLHCTLSPLDSLLHTPTPPSFHASTLPPPPLSSMESLLHPTHTHITLFSCFYTPLSFIWAPSYTHTHTTPLSPMDSIPHTHTTLFSCFYATPSLSYTTINYDFIF